MITKKKLVSVIATAAAIAFATAPIASSSALAHGVKCYGVNGCKGKSGCKTAKNSCKGQNACKGQGVMKMSAKKCSKMGGTTEEPKS